MNITWTKSIFLNKSVIIILQKILWLLCVKRKNVTVVKYCVFHKYSKYCRTWSKYDVSEIL